MPLPHLSNSFDMTILKNQFYLDFGNYDDAGFSLNRLALNIKSNTIEFRMAIFKAGTYVPLDIILKHLNVKRTLTIDYRDVNSSNPTIRYTLNGFHFTKILNLLDIEFNRQTDLHQTLIVEYDYDDIKYSNFVGEKNQRMQKLHGVINDEDYGIIIDKKILK